MCSCSSIVQKRQRRNSMYIDPIHRQHWQMILLVHLKILRSTICKVPGLQVLADSISRIQELQVFQAFPGFQDFHDCWPPWRCSRKKVPRKDTANSQENTHAEVWSQRSCYAILLKSHLHMGTPPENPLQEHLFRAASVFSYLKLIIQIIQQIKLCT